METEAGSVILLPKRLGMLAFGESSRAGHLLGEGEIPECQGHTRKWEVPGTATDRSPKPNGLKRGQCVWEGRSYKGPIKHGVRHC